MATAVIELQAITDRKVMPVRYIQHQMIGSDYVDVQPGKYLEVDNVWELLGMKIRLVTSADVANRELTASIRHGISTNQIDVFKSAVVPASQDETMYIGKLAEIDASDIQLSNYMGWSNYCMMIGGDSWFRLAVTNGHANDVVYIYSRWRWLNWELGMIGPETLPSFDLRNR